LETDRLGKRKFGCFFILNSELGGISNDSVHALSHARFGFFFSFLSFLLSFYMLFQTLALLPWKGMYKVLDLTTL
jgi:hypothetical protein